MPAVRIARKNDRLLPSLRGLAFGAIALGAMNATHFYPGPLPLAIAAVAALLGWLSPTFGTLVIVVGVALPMLAADLATGAAFALVGIAGVQYLGQSKASPFLAVGFAMLATAFGGEWAVPVLAGYLLGASEGAAAAAVACVVIEAAGLLLGLPRLGVVVAGGGKAALAFKPIADALAFGWISASVKHATPNHLVAAITSAHNLPALVVQPALWGAAAWLAGRLRRPVGHARRLQVGVAVAAATSLAIAALSSVATAALGAPVPLDVAAVAGVVSLVVALVVAVASDTAFAPYAIAPDRKLNTTAQEDADVDELLRLIAQAEDELASKHTSESVVMITDMKSFSKMTEEDGSLLSAKMIQRHRDLLLPVIESGGGHGKSTGGDGLVAAFPSARTALDAAVAMQRTLQSFNASRLGERELQVRIGIAQGEVVLDRSGRPFIGNGLNKAARVMNLADGAQIFASSDVVAAADGFDGATLSHGKHELKNIAEPVEVLEVVWAEQAREAS